MKTIQIGDTPLAAITQEHLLQIVTMEGCAPSPEYWNLPIATDFDDTMFSDSIVIDYHCFRKSDNLQSSTFVFFFNHKGFDFHYHKEGNHERNGRNRFSLETISFLIKEGYSIPL